MGTNMGVLVAICSISISLFPRNSLATANTPRYLLCSRTDVVLYLVRVVAREVLSVRNGVAVHQEAHKRNREAVFVGG